MQKYLKSGHCIYFPLNYILINRPKRHLSVNYQAINTQISSNCLLPLLRMAGINYFSRYTHLRIDIIRADFTNTQSILEQINYLCVNFVLCKPILTKDFSLNFGTCIWNKYFEILKNSIKQTLKVVFFLALSCFLFWLVYRGQDIDQMKSVLANDVNYKWVWFSLVLGLLSHISRSIRWIMLIEPLGKRPRFINSFLSVMVGYLMNLALPRMGEISRCTALSRYEGISFTKLVGTVVIERTIDVIIMLLFTAFVILAQFKQVLQLLDNNPELHEKINNFSFSPLVIGIIFSIVILIIWLCIRLRNGKLGQKVKTVIINFIEGLKTIGAMKNKWLFILHSLFIWAMYFLMMYVMFFAFDFTSHLSWLVGLTVFVFGTYGMVAPVQGGIGAWHFMVIQGLIIYGIPKEDGLIFAFLTHGSMNAMIIIVGLISVLLLPIVNKKNTNSIKV